MRVLYAYNKHRGHGGGGDYTANATLETLRRNGYLVEVFTRNSDELGEGMRARLKAGLHVLHAPDSVRRIGELIESFRPDLVHIHEVFPLVSSWILPECARRGVPVVCTCIDYRITCPVVTHFYRGQVCDRCSSHGEHWAIIRNCRDNLPESVMAAVYTGVSRKLGLFRRNVAHYIAPSEFTRSWLIGHAAVDPSRVTAIPVVVNAPLEPADPGHGSYVAFAGRLTAEKGVETFIEASRLSDVPFRIAVPERGRVALKLPPDANVVVTRSREDLDAFYRQARMVVVPSLWFETFGLVGAEAMSYGIPIVASRIGAIGQLITDGVHGLHFEPGNAAELTARVRRLWDDPALCRRMGDAARQKAVAEWSADRHFELTREVYDGVLRGAALSASRPGGLR